MNEKLACPTCGSRLSKVTNARDDAVGTGFWRRRECLTCKQRFTTEEVIRGVYPLRESSTGIRGQA